MKYEQFCRLMRCIGILEGYGMGLEGKVRTEKYWTVIDDLIALAEEITPFTTSNK